MTRLLGVFGSSGFAREVMPLVASQALFGDRIVFVDREERPMVNGYQVIDEASYFSWGGERRYVIAISDGNTRRRLDYLAYSKGAMPLDVHAHSAEVLDAVEFGPGAVLCGHTTITSNVRIGRGFHLNLNSYIAHDCVIGDYVTIAPSVACNGNTVIGDGAYIGAGAVMRQGVPDKPLTIGAGAVIGMGAVVTTDVAPGDTVIGNPARLLARPPT
jgi:sugar O-acyltransferase (sialic acid O-acetyltransferase NeuD family)